MPAGRTRRFVSNFLEIAVPIKVKCPSCQSGFTAPDNAAGKKAKCPKCGGAIEIPTPEPPEEVLEAEVAPDWGFDDDDFDVEKPAELPAQAERKPCPMCGEMIANDAVKCRFCGEVFDPALKKKMKKRGQSEGDADLSVGEWVLAILCSGIACILGIVWMIQGKPKGSKMVMVAIAANICWAVVRVLIATAVEAGR